MTSAFGGQRSIQLSYGCLAMFSAPATRLGLSACRRVGRRAGYIQRPARFCQREISGLDGGLDRGAADAAAAADIENLAGDEPGRRRQEKGDGAGDLLRRADPAEGDLRRRGFELR